MKRTPQQQLLNLSHPPTYEESDFYVTPCNQVAFEWIKSWPKWPTHCLILYGARGTGKTHLTNIWKQYANAKNLSCAELEQINIDQVCRQYKNIILEDIPLEFDQPLLFHLYNAVKQADGYLILTSEFSPKEWKVTLPDLTSRLRSALWEEMSAADDELLRAVLHKIISDKQITVPLQVINYLLNHHDRSLIGLQNAINTVNDYAFAAKRKITLPLVKESLKIQ